MTIHMIVCQGKCKKTKSVACFAPSQVKAEHPMCIECNKQYRQDHGGRKATGTKRGWKWKKDFNLTLSGSRRAMERAA
jgi:hypothetical protein